MYQRFITPGTLMGVILVALVASFFVGYPVYAADCAWTGTISTAWSNPGNWSNCNGTIPGASDTVTISNTPNDPILSANTAIAGLTINISGELAITNGFTLTVNGAFTLQGVLTGAGNLEINGSMSWTGGTMSGSGTTTILPGSTLTTSGFGKTLDGRILNNEGTIVRTGTSQILGQNGAILNNLPGAVFDMQNDAPFNVGTGGATFNNEGTVIKSAGTGISRIYVVFNNNGLVEVNVNTLSLVGSGSSNGTFSVLSGAILRFEDNTYTLNPGSLLTGAGDLHITSSIAVLNMDGDYGLTGTTAISGGIVNLNQDMSIPNLTISGGLLQGSGTLTVTNNLNWAGGGMAGSGTTYVASSADFTISGVSKTLNGRILNNDSTAVWSGSSPIRAQGGAVINNLPGATFDIQTGSSLTLEAGSATFNNQGTWLNSVGNGTMSIGVSFHNFNDVQVQSGTLHLAGNGSHSGTFQVETGATLRFDGTTQTLEAPSLVTGAGNVSIGTGAVNLNLGGTYNITGATTINGGTANFLQNITLLTLTINGGVLNSASTITIADTLNWMGGRLTGNITNISASADLAIGGSNKVLDGLTLNNHGNTTWTGTAQIQAINGATFNNQGTFNWNGDSNFAMGSGGGVFINEGTILKSVGNGASGMNIPFTNNNLLQVYNGSLEFNNVTTTTGSLLVESPAAVQLNATSHLFAAGSQVNGDGLIIIGPGSSTAVISGTYHISGTTTINGGTAVFNTSPTFATLNLSAGTLQNNLPATISQTFNWSGGTLTGEGLTEVIPGAALNLSSGTKILDTVLHHAGSGTWTGAGALQGINAAQFNILPGGTIDIQSSPSFTGDATLHNQGNLIKSGGTTNTNFSIVVDNSGTMSILTGTVQLPGNGTSTGSITGNGRINFNGSGTAFTSSGNFNIDNVTISGSTVLFHNDAIIANLLMINGELAGSGTVTVTQSFDWSNGLLADSGETVVLPGATLTLRSNSAKVLDGRTLYNHGTTTWLNNGILQGINGGLFHNLPDGLFTITSGTAVINTPFFNNGLIQIPDRIMQIGDVFNSDGNIIGDGELIIHSNALTVTISGLYQLTGTTTISGGNVIFTNLQTDLGNLELNAGSFTLDNTLLGIQGDFIRHNSVFTSHQSTVVFQGATTQNLTFETPTTLNHVTVLTNTTLIETVAANNVTVGGNLTNYGTIRKSLQITDTGVAVFGLTNITVTIVTRGQLSRIQVDRIDSNHPNATNQNATGRYWFIITNGINYLANLTLPHQVSPPKDAQLCQYIGGSWRCVRHWYTDATVTLGFLTALTNSTWAVGTGPMYDTFLPVLQSPE